LVPLRKNLWGDVATSTASLDHPINHCFSCEVAHEDFNFVTFIRTD